MIQKPSNFELLGHDCPLGRYPAPVVPIGRKNNQLVAVYLDYSAESKPSLSPINEDSVFVNYGGKLKESLFTFDSSKDQLFAISENYTFDSSKDRLFAISENKIVSYKSSDENALFKSLLKDHKFSETDPFFRLSLAKLTRNIELITSELKKCGKFLISGKYSQDLAKSWYEKEKDKLLSLWQGNKKKFPDEDKILPTTEVTNRKLPITKNLIFEPLQFRHLTVKNRIFRSSVTGRWDNYNGSGTQARVNWENKFAKGGVGAIISSYAPISIEGRITPNVVTIDCDERIPFWHTVGETVRRYGCKYIIQLSHSGRQRDIEGIENTQTLGNRIEPVPAPSTTNEPDQVNGLPANKMSTEKVRAIIQDFARAAGRAKEANLDGIELHSSHGYLINQFLSSAINQRTDEYGGNLKNRYRFLKEIVAAIRQVVGDDFHLQAKISVREFNNIIPPWGKTGNTFEEAIQICQWLEDDGIDALHISRGSTFPHPLLPSGPFPLKMLRYTYDTMTSSGGKNSFRNTILFRYPLLWPIFQWIWGLLPNKVESRYQQPISGETIQDEWLDEFFREHISTEEFQALLNKHQGTVLADAQQIKQHLKEIPVITTGGFQQASYINQAIEGGYTDGVSMARMLVANNDLVNKFQAGLDIAEKPCTYCNECLGAYLELPLGCYTLDRFYQRSIQNLTGLEREKADREAEKARTEQVMTVFEPPPKPYLPPM